MTFQELSAHPALQTGGAVAVALGLVEVVKILIGKVSSRTDFSEKDRGKIASLYYWHAPDSNGFQSWRTSREDLREMIALQREALDVLKRIERNGHG